MCAVPHICCTYYTCMKLLSAHTFERCVGVSSHIYVVVLLTYTYDAQHIKSSPAHASLTNSMKVYFFLAHRSRMIKFIKCICCKYYFFHIWIYMYERKTSHLQNVYNCDHRMFKLTKKKDMHEKYAKLQKFILFFKKCAFKSNPALTSYKCFFIILSNGYIMSAIL